MPKPLCCKPIPVIGCSIQPFISSIVHRLGIFIAPRRRRFIFLNVSYPPSPVQPIPNRIACAHHSTPSPPTQSIPLLPIINRQWPPLAFNHRPSIASTSQHHRAFCCHWLCRWGPLGWHGVRTEPTACV